MQLKELLDALEEANHLLKDAEAAESRARSATTELRNKVSSIQKSIDAEMAKLKEQASWSTEWHSQRTRVVVKTA